jgi:hypothetical protein
VTVSGSSQAPTAAVDNSALPSTRPQSAHKSGKAVHNNGAASVRCGSLSNAQLSSLRAVDLHHALGHDPTGDALVDADSPSACATSRAGHTVTDVRPVV